MFALIASPRADVDERELSAMAAALRNSARPVAQFHDAERRAGLAAGTLGTLPEDAFDRQPLIDDDLVFVAQARIDNREGILERLGIARERWSGLADSDVVHMAYRRWGEDCPRELTGDYAFAAWHRRTGRVVAAVDHLATARLYYAQAGAKLLISTQLGALLAHPGVSKDVDLTALGLFVTPRIEQGTTPFKNIFQLQGGHSLTWQAGAPQSRQWWRPDTVIRTQYRDPRDYVMRTRALFDAAVTACSRRSGGLAATLSGGLDSALVAATAALQMQERGELLQTYTSVPEPGLACDRRPGWEIDDSSYVHDLAAVHENLRTSFVTPGGRCTLDLVPQIHAVSHTPVRNGASHLWSSRICETSAAAGARVILGGFKGNATLSQGGEGGIGHLLRRLRWNTAFHAATEEARQLGQLGRPLWRVLAREVAGQHGRRIYDRVIRQASATPPPGSNLLTAAFRAVHESRLVPAQTPPGSRAAQVAFTVKPAHGWSADSIAQWGVELRDPTADRLLIECLLSFPPDAFLTEGRARGLARAIGADRLPDSIRLRTSKGEQTPELAAIVAAHAATYRQTLARVADIPLFRETIRIDRLNEVVGRLCAGDGSRHEARTVDRALDVGLFMAAYSLA